MIDTKALINQFDEIKSRLAIKKVSEETLSALKDMALKYKSCKQELEELQAFQNKTSKLFGEYKREQKDITALKVALDENKVKMSTLESTLKEIESHLETLAYGIPNLPDDATPEGEDENDNVEIKKVLSPPHFDFVPKEHWELGIANGWIDFEAGVKLAKSRFSVLRGMGAKLNRALINFMLDYNEKAGFESIVTPVIVNARALFGTGQLPKFEEDMFKVDQLKFLEAMADAATSVVEYLKGKIVYINMLVNLSVDCDCCAVAEDPCMQDIGMMISLDPLAIDQACIDMVYASKDKGRDHFVARVERQNGLHTLEAAEHMGLGSRSYELVNMDE